MFFVQKFKVNVVFVKIRVAFNFLSISTHVDLLITNLNRS